MIRALIAAFGAISLCATAVAAQDYPPQPKAGAPKPFRVPQTETFALPNGMSVTLVPTGIVPKAFVSLQIAAGSLNEGENVWLASLTAQLMREGAAGRSGAQIAPAAASMGGSLGLGATTHHTVLSLYTLSDRAPDALRLIGDVARRPDFPSSELDRVRQNLLRGLAVARAQPGSAAEVALAAAYYGNNHPYGRVVPTEAQLRAYSLAEVRRFHADNFGARRARLYIAGQFDAAAVRAAIQQAFADWQPGPEPLKLPPSPQAGPRVILVDRPGAPQSTIRLAFAAPIAGSASDLPFQVTNALLGGSFSSRITQNIREQKGYTYSPNSGVRFNAGEALWAVQADVTTDVTGASLKEVFGEIRRLQTEPAPDAESLGMRTWMAGVFVLRNAGAPGLVNSLSDRDFHGLPANWLDAYVPSVMAVTPAQMQRLAREQLPLDKLTLVVVGDLAKVRPQLAALPELNGIEAKLVTPFGP